jgi:DeoR/GlpR family transcriptional regulator of sugar metabolism
MLDLKAHALPVERRDVILERIRRDGRVLSRGLAQEFDTSEDTIRRHLRELSDAGLCMRVHGGAVRPSPASGSFSRRLKEDVGAKSRLATAAADQVEDGQTIFIDAGTTNLELARALPDLPLTIITNAPAIAAALVDRPSFSVVILGGPVRRQTGAVAGTEALASIRVIRPDITFLGACAIDPEEGVAAFDPEDAEVKRALVACSRSLTILAAAGKIGAGAPYIVCPVDAIDRLVVEAGIDEAVASAFRTRGVEIVVAP